MERETDAEHRAADARQVIAIPASLARRTQAVALVGAALLEFAVEGIGWLFLKNCSIFWFARSIKRP